MHKARAFFFVCAGLLCLALAYHLGARSAGAQSGGQFRVAGWTSGSSSSLGEIYVVAGETMYNLWSGSGQAGWSIHPGPMGVAFPVPTDQIAWYNGNQLVTTAGEGWGFSGTYQHWIDCGPVPGSTPTAQSTWGQVKAKYATPAPGKVTR
jgi:hypothetical protein